MNNIEEDYKLFQLVKRNPIKNCIDLSKNMTGKRNGLFYFTKSFRIDFENKMCDLERLKAEHEVDKKRIKQLKEENRVQRSQLMSAFDRGFIPKQIIIDAIARNLEKDNAGRLIFDFNSCQKLSIEIVKLMREGI